MKRICALLLCGALMLPQPAAEAAGSWPSWAEDALAWGQEVSISGEFLEEPEQTVTRAMAAQLLYEAAGEPAVSGECPFTDVSGDEAGAVTWAAERGYLTGVGDGKYEPTRSVTRQEFAAILWRRAGSPGVAVQGLDQFRDAGTVADWAGAPVLWALQAGVMAGFPVVDVKVTLFDGSYHEVDSSEMAFKIAGSMAFKEACRKANPTILEPIMKVAVTVPDDYMGVVIGDITARRGNILGQITRTGSVQVDANVPLAEMFGYATDLRSKTQGRGNYSMEPSHYSELPKSKAEEIIKARTKD